MSRKPSPYAAPRGKSTFSWYRPARTGGCFFTDAERAIYNQARADAEAAHAQRAPGAALRCEPPYTQARLRFVYGRGWATALAALPSTMRFEHRDPAKPQAWTQPDKPRALDAWTRAHDRIARAALDAGTMGGVELSFAAAELSQPLETDTMPAKNRPAPRQQPSAPRTISTDRAAPARPVILDDAAAKSERAKKAWATRRAQGWVHPASVNRPPPAPVEPLRRASLAAIAAGAKVTKPVDEITPTARAAVAEKITAAAKPAKKAPKAPATKPARAPAKKAAPKVKRPKKAAPKAAPAPARRGR